MRFTRDLLQSIDLSMLSCLPLCLWAPGSAPAPWKQPLRKLSTFCLTKAYCTKPVLTVPASKPANPFTHIFLCSFPSFLVECVSLLLLEVGSSTSAEHHNRDFPPLISFSLDIFNLSALMGPFNMLRSLLSGEVIIAKLF